jgi:hypothetical protein
MGGCSNKNETSDIGRTEVKQSIIQISKAEWEEAKETITNYVKALNDNNYDEFLRYLSPSQVQSAEQNRIKHNIVPKYQYARVIKITPNDSEKNLDAYLKHGRGKDKKLSKLVIFKVDWEYKLSPNGIDENVDKKVSWKYILIKEKENDVWKIDDFGY